MMQGKKVRPLILQLKAMGFQTEIETSGFYLPPSRLEASTYVVDYKMPSSGAESRYIMQWVDILRETDLVKIVVSSPDDLDYITTIRHKLNRSRAPIGISPAIWDIQYDLGQIVIPPEQVNWLQEVSNFCLRMGYRLNTQQHKFIWGKENNNV